MPVELQPLLRWRMAAWPARRGDRSSRVARERPALVAEMLRAGRRPRSDPRAANRHPRARSPRPGHMWNWHDGKIALEYLFWTGQVTAARRVNFERLYDRPSACCRRRSSPRRRRRPADAQRELRPDRRAARSASRPSPTSATTSASRAPTRKARSPSWSRPGELVPVEVEGWAAPAYLWPEARGGRAGSTPARCSRRSTRWSGSARGPSGCSTSATASRSTRRRPSGCYGYYVLPFLLGDGSSPASTSRPTGRPGVLRVQGAYAEPGVDRRRRRGARRGACGWPPVARARRRGRRAAGDLADELAARNRRRTRRRASSTRSRVPHEGAG